MRGIASSSVSSSLVQLLGCWCCRFFVFFFFPRLPICDESHALPPFILPPLPQRCSHSPHSPHHAKHSVWGVINATRTGGVGRANASPSVFVCRNYVDELLFHPCQLWCLETSRYRPSMYFFMRNKKFFLMHLSQKQPYSVVLYTHTHISLNAIYSYSTSYCLFAQ